MRKKIDRKIDIAKVKKLISLFPVTAILGPRQSGKTVLAGEIGYDHYFDLENPRDLAKFEQAQLLLEDLKGLIVIDEVQRSPELFPLIRYLTDNDPRQKYLMLGSASGELLKQTSESLAGRVAYFDLGGLRISDVGSENIKKLWLRGGFPRAYLADDDTGAFLWLSNYVSTLLERDLPQMGITIPANTLRRFWTMICHYHGQVVNYSEIGRSFGVSDMTVRKYLDILEKTFMLRLLQPWYVNLGKRLVKRPKVYVRDPGIYHSLMSIESPDTLISHNKLGASWEGFALEAAARSIGKRGEELYFWSTHTGAEVDLFWQDKGLNWAVECKYDNAPSVTKSMKTAMKDLELKHLWVVYPGKESYKLDKAITALPLSKIGDVWEY